MLRECPLDQTKDPFGTFKGRFFVFEDAPDHAIIFRRGTAESNGLVKFSDAVPSDLAGNVREESAQAMAGGIARVSDGNSRPDRKQVLPVDA